MDNNDLERSAKADGLLPTVEPVPVSPLRAAIPSAGDFVLFRQAGSYERVAVVIARVASVTPKMVKLSGHPWAKRCSLLDVVASTSDEETAKRMRDSIAGVAGEFSRRRRAAEDERSRRITEALTAANRQVERIVAQGMETRRAETPAAPSQSDDSPVTKSCANKGQVS